MKIDKNCLVRIVIDSVESELKEMGKEHDREEIRIQIPIAFKELNRRFQVGLSHEEIEESSLALIAAFEDALDYEEIMRKGESECIL